MGASTLFTGAVFLLVSAALAGLVFHLGRRSRRLDGRLLGLTGRGAPASEPATPSLGRLARLALPGVAAPFLPTTSEQRTRLQARLWQAGLYRRQAMVVYVSAKAFLLFAPWVVGLGAGLAGAPMTYAVAGGAVLSLGGLLGPSFWLDGAKKRRHRALRRGLPDVLDVLVLCLEAGVSLGAAFRLVADEVRASHPLLGFELRMVQREMQLGRSLGEALRGFAERSDLDEVSALASVVDQAERLGASLVKALRSQAELQRYRRSQQAEERAQQAGARVLLPTMLFLFPCIFVILLGPAALQVKEVMDRRKAQVKSPGTKGKAAQASPAKR